MAQMGMQRRDASGRLGAEPRDKKKIMVNGRGNLGGRFLTNYRNVYE